MIKRLSYLLTAIAILMFWAGTARADVTFTAKVKSLTCAYMPEDVKQRVLDAEWILDEEKAGCLSCMACGCTCSTTDYLVSGDMHVGYRSVSCESDVYPLRIDNKVEYECTDIQVLKLKQIPADLSVFEKETDCGYPDAELVHTENTTADFRGSEYGPDQFTLAFYHSRDPFYQVKQYYDLALGESAPGFNVDFSIQAVYRLGPARTLTVIDAQQEGAYIIVSVWLVRHEGGEPTEKEEAVESDGPQESEKTDVLKEPAEPAGPEEIENPAE